MIVTVRRTWRPQQPCAGSCWQSPQSPTEEDKGQERTFTSLSLDATASGPWLQLHIKLLLEEEVAPEREMWTRELFQVPLEGTSCLSRDNHANDKYGNVDWGCWEGTREMCSCSDSSDAWRWQYTAHTHIQGFTYLQDKIENCQLLQIKTSDLR